MNILHFTYPALRKTHLMSFSNERYRQPMSITNLLQGSDDERTPRLGQRGVRGHQIAILQLVLYQLSVANLKYLLQQTLKNSMAFRNNKTLTSHYMIAEPHLNWHIFQKRMHSYK